MLRGEALVAPRRLPDAHFTQGRALPSQGCPRPRALGLRQPGLLSNDCHRHGRRAVLRLGVPGPGVRASVFEPPPLLHFELTSEGKVRTASQSQSTGPVPWTPAWVGGALVGGRSPAKVDPLQPLGHARPWTGSTDSLPAPTQRPKGCSFPRTRPPSSRGSGRRGGRGLGQTTQGSSSLSVWSNLPIQACG